MKYLARSILSAASLIAWESTAPGADISTERGSAPIQGVLVTIVAADVSLINRSGKAPEPGAYFSGGIFVNPLVSPNTEFYGNAPQATVVGFDCGRIYLRGDDARYCEIAADKYAVIGHFYLGAGKLTLPDEELNSVSARMQAFFMTFRLQTGLSKEGTVEFVSLGIGTGFPGMIASW